MSAKKTTSSAKAVLPASAGASRLGAAHGQPGRSVPGQGGRNPRALQVPDAAKILADSRLRATAARVAVLQALQGASQAMSHADLDASLADKLDRVTLYRTLDSFVEAGLVARSVGHDRVSRYVVVDAGVDHHAHAHFQCDDCGRMFCLPAKPPRSVALPEGFIVTEAELNFHGHCATCLALAKDSGQMG